MDSYRPHNPLAGLLDGFDSAPPPRTSIEKTETCSGNGEADALVALWQGGRATAKLPARGSVLIGRDPACGLSVPHAHVSGRHARVDVSPDGITIADLGSHNGTRVDGRLLAEGEAARIGMDATVRLGLVTVLLEDRVLRIAASRASHAPRAPHPLGIHVPDGPPMSLVHERIADVAPRGVSVVIAGETGTGKEIAARSIHLLSRRANGPFVAVNCGAIPAALVESFLFGHKKGAFTGATADEAGVFEQADKGTLFLDELHAMPDAVQVAVLRVLSAREVQRVGCSRVRKVDTRIVVATHKDLAEAVASGRLHEDLHGRLDGIAIHMPPLRERRGEIRPLAEMFLREIAARDGVPLPRLTDAAMRALSEHAWPTNIRGLRAACERAVMNAKSAVIEPEHLQLPCLPGVAAPPPPPPRPEPIAPPAAPEDPEKRRIMEALDACTQNQTQAAKLIGMPLRTFVRRVRDLGLKRPRR